VIASGAPPARAVRFDVGFAVLRGHFPAFGGVDAVYSPRRTVLDALLVDAARQAGAEVREGFTVEEIISVDGPVQGIRGRDSDGAPVTETARQVLGADGKRSQRRLAGRGVQSLPLRRRGQFPPHPRPGGRPRRAGARRQEGRALPRQALTCRTSSASRTGPDGRWSATRDR
jgi:hypothetical protein